MYIKQWLQEPLQKRQCEMIIDQTIWELGVKPKTIEKEVTCIQTNALGQPMRCYGRVYDGIDLYQKLLDYKFDEDLEFRFMQYLQILKTTIVPLEEILAVLRIQSSTIQNMTYSDGTIKKGLDHNAAQTVFRILQSLVRKHYATI